jgi:drug/metabolite transporter (DMT)-like permease
VVVIGLLMSLVYQVLFIRGIAGTSASHTGFLIASGPLWTALIARLSGVERPGRRAWAGLGVAFVGTVLVAGETDGGGEASLAGNLLLLLAMLVWAFGTVQSRPLLESFPATRLAYLCTLVGLPGHWLLAWPHLDPVLAGRLSAWNWAAVVYSGLLSTGLAYVLWNRSVRRLGPARTSALSNLVPLVALAVAWAALGERPGAIQLLGGALVLVGTASWRVAVASAPAGVRS